MPINEHDGNSPRPGQPKSKAMWIVGLVLLALVAIIAVRAFVAGSTDVTAANADNAPITETDQAIAGTKVQGNGQ
jgi:flagellar basal body-associated protein FliL